MLTNPLLLLGGASAAPGRDCLDQARARDLPVWLVDTPEHLAAVPELTERAAEVVELPFHDVAACTAWALDGGRRLPRFCGVYGFREQAVESVAAVADALGLPGNGLPTARLLRDKAACREALRERGFRQPPSARCQTEAEAVGFALAHPPGPWVIKPRQGQGSVGVTLVRDPAEVAQALEHIVASVRAFSRDAGLPEPAAGAAGFLIEGFQRGDEYSVEGVCVDGVPHVLAVTQKLTNGAPHFVEMGHSMPAELSPAREAAVSSTVRSALTALAVRWGVFHVECWLDGTEVVIGEVHNRPGGGHIHTMTQHITGVELHGAVFDQMLGRPVDTSGWRPGRGAAIRFLAPDPGRVMAITGWQAASADPAVLIAHQGLAAGDVICAASSYLDRTSYLVVTGETGRAAAATAARLCATVSVEVDIDVVAVTA
ncbi:MAG TPA: ATP-grasp domain-containing protein [Streptosporangiaceae bacterium]|nr:ATP-grasp domain-containing protein [Streptosporangiaceae bacterium]